MAADLSDSRHVPKASQLKVVAMLRTLKLANAKSMQLCELSELGVPHSTLHRAGKPICLQAQANNGLRCRPFLTELGIVYVSHGATIPSISKASAEPALRNFRATYTTSAEETLVLFTPIQPGSTEGLP